MGRHDHQREPKLNPYEKRLRDTDGKLRAALERLVRGHPINSDLQKGGYRLTVATLAREAGVGRNAIYTNHRAMIDKLRSAGADTKCDAIDSWADKLAELHAVISTMKLEQRRLVTENAMLLKRARDAEAEADRYRRHNARLISNQNVPLRTVVSTNNKTP